MNIASAQKFNISASQCTNDFNVLPTLWILTSFCMSVKWPCQQLCAQFGSWEIREMCLHTFICLLLPSWSYYTSYLAHTADSRNIVMRYPFTVFLSLCLFLSCPSPSVIPRAFVFIFRPSCPADFTELRRSPLIQTSCRLSRLWPRAFSKSGLKRWRLLWGVPLLPADSLCYRELQLRHCCASY